MLGVLSYIVTLNKILSTYAIERGREKNNVISLND